METKFVLTISHSDDISSSDIMKKLNDMVFKNANFDIEDISVSKKIITGHLKSEVCGFAADSLILTDEDRVCFLALEKNKSNWGAGMTNNGIDLEDVKVTNMHSQKFFAIYPLVMENKIELNKKELLLHVLSAVPEKQSKKKKH